MNVDELREYCLSFPDTTEKLQWGDALCFKVGGKKAGGKMFFVLGLDDLRMSFKCTPEKFAELIEREGLRPAPYVGRYKWVMADRLDALGGDELRDLIRQSYEMVAAKAPKTKAKNAAGRRARKKTRARRTKATRG